jgi:hypothetical protein
MKSTRQKRKAPKNGPRPAGPPPVVRRPVPLSGKDRRVMRLIGALAMAFGGMLLLKVVLTVRSGTAWDDLSMASREAQVGEFWSFVVTYFLLGVGLVWLGVNIWRSR